MEKFGGGQEYTSSEKTKVGRVNNLVQQEDWQSKECPVNTYTKITPDYSCTPGTYLVIVHADTNGASSSNYNVRIYSPELNIERVTRMFGNGGGGNETIICLTSNNNFTVSVYGYATGNTNIIIRTRTTIIRLY